jgi:hypothetical protein
MELSTPPAPFCEWGFHAIAKKAPSTVKNRASVQKNKAVANRYFGPAKQEALATPGQAMD